MMDWQPGLYTAEQIPESVYHQDDFGDVPTLSRGVATRIVEESLLAAHYFHPRLGDHDQEISEEKQKNLDAGNVRHSMILGSGAAFEIVRGFTDWKKDAAKEGKATCRKAGKIPLLEKDYEKHLTVVEKVLPRIVSIVGRIPADAETTALWEEPGEPLGFGPFEDGELRDWRGPCRCKTRIDIPLLDFPGATVPGTMGPTVLRPGAWIFDLKGAPRIGPSWERGGESIGLDIQAYLHVHAMEVLVPELAGRINFADIVFQTVPPYDVAVITWPQAPLEKGKMRWERALRLWAGALASGEWPGVGGRQMEVRPWELEREQLLSGFYEVEGPDGPSV